MKTYNAISLLSVIFFMLIIYACNVKSTTTSTNDQPAGEPNMKLNKLTKEEERVIIHKGTEAPGIGKYTDTEDKGTYICKQCDAPLYKSESKFHSGCGWPSFDDEIKGAVTKVPDADGHRVEIICSKCKGHLGHVFTGEGFTEKNTRHCVNSISMKFIPEGSNPVDVNKKIEKAIFAGGCFWGVEFYFQKAKGVISTQVGYIGGQKENPTYKEVCSHKTGHIEALEVTFDANVTTYEDMAKLFFEIHDPTQVDGQGNDIGNQYISAIFYHDDTQKATAEKLIGILTIKGYKVATKLIKATKFWPAEDYHQQYYEKTGGTPYCHRWKAKF